MESNSLPTPGFKIGAIPNVKIKSLNVKNFKVYDNCCFDFSDKFAHNKIKPFICFMGTNGTGKSTVLNIIQMLFQRYEGYEKDRLLARLGKCIRHNKNDLYGVYSNDNFLIEAEIVSSIGNYTLRFDKNGFIDDHPDEIKKILYRLCYYARFDKELEQFQLVRNKWDNFKKLFESITEYEIEEMQDVFSSSSDPAEANMMKKYVLGFIVKKPFETIRHKECSNGEKKIIKSFSTLLNLEIVPQIILIDDIAMHVALEKHMSLIEAMQECYPRSQIISTTHSYRIAKNLKMQPYIYDLRYLHVSDLIKREPWRINVIDEINDALYKLSGIDTALSKKMEYDGKKLKNASTMTINDLEKYKNDVSKFLKEVSDLYFKCVLSCGSDRQITRNFNS